jgi:hypothetical protein
MAWKHLALAAALLGVATPGEAFDQRNEAQTVMFYYAFPLDARTDKERIPWVGLQIQGKRDYQSFNFDTRLFSLAEGGSAAANAAIIGVVAVGAAVAVSQRGKSSQQEVQQQQAANPPAPASSGGGDNGSCQKTC